MRRLSIEADHLYQLLVNNMTDKSPFSPIGAQDLCRLHEDTPENKIKRTYLRNLHAFMARLTRNGVSDCSYQALQAITQALERADPPITTRTMDMLILYDWARLAVNRLMEGELKNTLIGGELWDVEKPGFSKERWKSWVKRLGDIEKDE